MSKKISFISIIMAVLVTISGCSLKEKPETAVSEFMEAMQDFDLKRMALVVNPSDEAAIEEIDDLSDDDISQKYFLDYIKSNAKKITYEIKEVKIDENNKDLALVKVDLKYVDGAPLFIASISEYIKEAFSKAITGEELTDEETSEMMISIMEEQSELIKEEYIEKTVKIKCIKVEDKWYIDNPNEILLNIAMSNILSAAKEIGDSFDFD